jgi:putative endonuclease
MIEFGYVYILASEFKHLYIGVTSHLEMRVGQHKDGTYPCSFTERYNIKQLVYFERFAEMQTAIAREKQLKRWSRIKKIRLIVAENPDWRDLSAEWGAPLALFDGLRRASWLRTKYRGLSTAHHDEAMMLRSR